LGNVPGALFRIDPATGSVEVVFSIRGVFSTPGAVAIDAEGNYLILDRDANPGGYAGAPGAIFRVRRSDLSVTPIFFAPEFNEPYDFLIDPSGDAWVLDRRAYITDPTKQGAVFRCNFATGEITKKEYSDYFSTLTGLTRFGGTPLEASSVSWEDLSGAPVQPTDRLVVRGRLHNSQALRVLQPDERVHRLPHRHRLLKHGGFSYFSRTARSSVGNISAGGAQIATRSACATGVDGPSCGAVRCRFPLLRTELSYEAVVQRQATPNSRDQGVVWEKPAGGSSPTKIFSGPPLVSPDDLVFLPDGRILVLDRSSYPRGPDRPPGGIYRIDPVTAQIDTLLAFEDYPSLRAPMGIADGAPDQLLITDRDANPLSYPGNPGAIFGLDLTTMELSVVAASPEFSDPVDSILETTGTILVVDIDADPSGLQPHAGALFEVNPVTSSVRAIPHPPNVR
jgi:sugar lactone lactonase YvrE